MKRKLLFLMALFVSSTMAWAESGSCGDNVTWDLTDGTLTISGSGAMTNYTTGGAPWYSSRGDIEQVVIENGVTTIGDYAFEGCTEFPSFDIPNSVTSIGAYAFKGCTNAAFDLVVIPANLKSIGEGAFQGCTGLSSISFFAQELTNYGENAFYNCFDNLKIYVPNETAATAYQGGWSTYSGKIIDAVDATLASILAKSPLGFLA